MNIPSLGQHLKAKDIMQKCKLFSLAFDGFEDREDLKKLAIFYPKNHYYNYLEFPKPYEYGFKKTHKYDSLISSRKEGLQTNEEVEQFLWYDHSQQIFIGQHDERFIFVDSYGQNMFIMKEEFLKPYVSSFLLNSNQNLLNNDFRELKNNFLSADLELFLVYEIEKMPS